MKLHRARPDAAPLGCFRLDSPPHRRLRYPRSIDEVMSTGEVRRRDRAGFTDGERRHLKRFWRRHCPLRLSNSYAATIPHIVLAFPVSQRKRGSRCGSAASLVCSSWDKLHPCFSWAQIARQLCLLTEDSSRQRYLHFLTTSFLLSSTAPGSFSGPSHCRTLEKARPLGARGSHATLPSSSSRWWTSRRMF